MYTFTLTEQFLNRAEQDVFADYIQNLSLDESIWDVFTSLFNSAVPGTRPFVLRVFQDGELCGAIILTRCSRYGRALFDSKLLAGLINLAGIPYFQWIRFGCCMDMMSNPGFVKEKNQAGKVIKLALEFLKKKGLITIVNDYTENIALYDSASVLPALPHALIDCSKLCSIDDYLKNYKNIKRKLKVFSNKGGDFAQVERKLDSDQLVGLKNCFQSTAENSIFYLPYQDLYLNAALQTSSGSITNVIYFIATLNGEFLGYQAALKTGKFLNALHGAFDRKRKTTFHAYDILFVKMTEYALENNLEVIDFGAVLNHTKKKMVNSTRSMSYFLMNRFAVIQWFFNILLKVTKIQGKGQLKFRP